MTDSMIIERPRFADTKEDHLPVAFAIDISQSMTGTEDEIHDCLETLTETLKENPETRGKVDMCVVTFDDEARIQSPFSSMYDFQAPEFTCGGCTHAHEAIGTCIDEIQAQRREYRDKGVVSMKPWFFFLSDGHPTDKDNGEIGKLVRSQKEDGWNVIPVAIGPHADRGFLSTLRVDGATLVMGQDNLTNFFNFVGDSLTTVSVAKIGEAVTLPDPKQYHMQLTANA